MQTKILSALALALCFSPACHAQGPAAIACVQDLESVPAFLLANDTGAPDHLAQLGQKHFDDALAEAKAAALQIRGNASCEPVLQQYLRAWRHGHLWVETIATAPSPAAAPTAIATAPQQPARSTAPALELLSAKTLRLTLKSFEPDTRDPLVALLNTHRADLESHPNWIIDVRGNPGGSDGSYAALSPWLIAEEVAVANTEILVTPANMEGWTRACALTAPADTQCGKILSDDIARMRKAADGTYIAENDRGAMLYNREDHPEPHRPARVAILIDGGCGSSCEEFVLTARQSFAVKLIGQHTHGSLDYASVRPHDLPSGKRRLWYTTTRSTRIPGLMIDVAGIQPDIYLPVDADDEVRRAQTWLEGGTLAPNQSAPLPTFDVASIHPMIYDHTDRTHIYNSPHNSEFKAVNVTLRDLLEVAYSLPETQMYNGPAWAESDKFDLEARSDAKLDTQLAALPAEQGKELKRQMLRALLIERFQLTAHPETRELPIYALIAAKGGAKLTPTAANGSTLDSGRGHINITGSDDSLAILAFELSWRLGRPVIDQTGSKGRYQLALKWTEDGDGPSLFTAIQEQLGLRLESTKGPVPVLVIDHAEKPTQN